MHAENYSEKQLNESSTRRRRRRYS